MRNTIFLSIAGVAALAVLAGCTVKDIDQPAFAGPSTFAHSIVMVADRHTLTQNGVDFTDITIRALGPDGRSENIPLRAQVFVDGIAQDFGTLSTKNPVTPATIRYTAPAASTLAGGQTPATVTIAVTPSGSGDFRSEFSRTIDLRLQPQGVILPSNPNLVSAFTFTPAQPQAGQTVSFDASTSTNAGTPCAFACTYSWNFGDGTTASGVTTTKSFRAPGNYAVQLTVTDARGAQQASVRTITVTNPAQPTGLVVVAPGTTVGTNTPVFFNASNVTWEGRTITGYSWNFGDGSTGTGITTTHSFRSPGAFPVVLTITDTTGTTQQLTTNMTVTAQGGAQARLTATPTSGRPGQRVVFDASQSTASTGAVITNYKFDWGEPNQPAENSTNPVQSHIYNAVGTYVASVEITDSNGKTSTAVVTVTISAQ
ncbi:MAG TPA: PKD domain-containing protein [Vicinamibacterales bacterium]|nr:PKD domain-containing protein [Vicinamibacterales bacterium]